MKIACPQCGETRTVEDVLADDEWLSPPCWNCGHEIPPLVVGFVQPESEHEHIDGTGFARNEAGMATGGPWRSDHSHGSGSGNERGGSVGA
jgi:hypothetical protein